ncbi:peroxiredoxin [Sinomonas cellulolyticus]|uniref:thioredoxin-dependent peroxiredoxin n=1 Tax=Sinomonas cellulolyticus TaxID=2801916 RepID=A0ABS1K4I6_9MICC|nr:MULTISPECIES: thioredoxin-dependent thiol peroxidase [Sinomonas]MBL0706434.1 thioredoxin-dependent thiol peroxidase [Sinomonas cellulolyticus]GHG44595.1 peroxiredoxin [Sinomonas sp. KCTC 49339]
MTTPTPARRLAVGDAAPDFSLPDSTGGTTSLADLAGTRTILYFFPKADTPGCTQEACDFRDSLAGLAGAGLRVLGVSPDPAARGAAFAAKHDLGFRVLADEDHRVAEAYGAWGEKVNYGRTYEGLIRSTFVIGADGRIELAQYNVRAKGHVAKLRRDLKILPLD